MILTELEGWLMGGPVNRHRSARLMSNVCELTEYPSDVAKGYGATLEEAIAQALTVAKSWAKTREGL